ncbi:rano class II histocompatibility antigen, D-1 beta chain-like [Lampris incognitus]|uniref:rano class II histocompatibility antigen, D-1 beta chain-like n=1 Tax=Lampris incognitus TaxID=2546036 RepID=UPI0024B539A0|nr:rano class II histocompatibility antigen, D-1 beta chain-like [Lampris incognitus]
MTARLSQQRAEVPAALLRSVTPHKILKTCQIIGDDSKQYDVRYKIQYHYNGQLMAQYNSSTETVTGYTDYGRQFADDVNKDINYLSLRRNDLNFFCKAKATVIYKAMLDKTVAPRVSLRMGRSKVVRDSTVLLCTAYDFYPRDIRLTWLRNGQVFPHTSEKLMQEELPSGAWRYQFHSHLEHTPAVGESISCMVEHASLWEPKLYPLAAT